MAPVTVPAEEANMAGKRSAQDKVGEGNAEASNAELHPQVSTHISLFAIRTTSLFYQETFSNPIRWMLTAVEGDPFVSVELVLVLPAAKSTQRQERGIL